MNEHEKTQRILQLKERFEELRIQQLNILKNDEQIPLKKLIDYAFGPVFDLPGIYDEQLRILEEIKNLENDGKHE